MARLDGKTALITGSTDGVGRAVAMQLGLPARASWCTAATMTEARA